MNEYNTAEIDEFDPKTCKLKSLKIAKKLGIDIPETLVIKDTSALTQGQIDKFTLRGWFLRECSTGKMFGQEISTSETVYTRELFFQKLISSEFSGNAWSYGGKIFIETTIGNGYGLNRMGFTPTTYCSVCDRIEVVRQNSKYEVRKGKTILKKCGKYSKPPNSVIKKLIKIAKAFPDEMIEWAYAKRKLFFLESYNYPPIVKYGVEDYLYKNSKIIFLPRSELALWPLCKNKEAVIVGEGGYSSHLAVLCGIFGKPFVRYSCPIPKNKKIKVEYAKLIFYE